MPDKKLNILFIGDVSGKIGRLVIKSVLAKLRKSKRIDVVIANADNIAHGKGATEATIRELISYGVDFFTSGDHAFDRMQSANAVYDSGLPVIRPQNFPPGTLGKGYSVLKTVYGDVLIINVLGRTYMRMDYDCPFRAVDNVLAKFAKAKFSAIIVDIHAEATSEKVAIREYLKGRVTAIIGTHTHVMTADAGIYDNIAYITDVGMTGAEDSVIGLEKQGIINTFLTQVRSPHVMIDSGKAQLNAVFIEVPIGKQGYLEISTIRKSIIIK